jgi:hypothetical protein
MYVVTNWMAQGGVIATLVRSSGRMQEITYCPSASPESQVDQRHSAPTPHIRHVAPWRFGYKHVSSTNLSTFSFSFQHVETTAELREPSPHSRARRSEGGTEARVTCSVLWIDSTRATTLFARRLHSCWEGSPISLSWVCPRKPPSLQEHTSASSKGAAYEAFIHIDQKPVWKVRFPNAPGSAQDYEVRQP